MPDRNPVPVDETEIIIRPLGLDWIWCFKKELRVPLGLIEIASVSPKPLSERAGIRLPGTDIGIKRCGTYTKDSKRSFWNVLKNTPALAIDCAPGAEYCRIVLSIPHPEAVALIINERLEHAS